MAISRVSMRVLSAVVGVSVASLVAADASQAAAFSPVFARSTAAGVSTVGAVKPTSRVSSRPDAVSAMLAARSQGSSVEVESARTDTDSTWANPDGTWTTKASAGPVRFRNAAGDWQPVDLTLKPASDGTVTASTPGGLTLAGGTASATGTAPSTNGTDFAVASETPASDRAAAAATGTERQVAWSLPWKLGKPTLSGSTATYTNVAPGVTGVDLVVQARRSGFEASFVIRSAAAVTALVSKLGGAKGATGANSASGGGGSVVWPLPVKTRGLTARAVTTGPSAGREVQFVDAKGVVRSTFALPTAYDAARDPHTGDPASSSQMTLAVTPQGTITGKSGKASAATVSIVPDLSWLTSPARTFPITIDPTYTGSTINPSLDTFTQQGYTTSQSSATELKLGNNGSGQVARSYLNFSTSGWAGKKIESAKLSLYETYSWSCSARQWDVRGVTAAATTSTVWTNQPGLGGSYASSTATTGYSSSCGAGWVSQDVASWMQAASTSSGSSGAGTTSLALVAHDETDSYGWKKFASSETAQDPTLTYTYDRLPNVPTISSINPSLSYKPADLSSAVPYVVTTKPSMTAAGTDPDGNNLKYSFEVYSSTAAGSPSVSGCFTGTVASGSKAGCALTTALADNSTYYVRAAGIDDQNKPGPFTGWMTFRTAVAAPPAPSISCPTNAAGSWSSTVPSSPVSCTVTVTGSGTTAPSRVWISVDGKAYQETSLTQPTSSSPRTVTTTVPATAGGHSVAALSISPSAVTSSTTSYAFGYGPAAIDTPTSSPIVTTSSAVKLSASGPLNSDGSLPSAVVQFRVAGSGLSSTASNWGVSDALCKQWV